MMKVLELMMLKSDLLKIMLTVFKHNDVASKFFKEVLRYEIDETCPYDTVYEQFDYEILSRYLYFSSSILFSVIHILICRFNLKEKKKREDKENTGGEINKITA